MKGIVELNFNIPYTQVAYPIFKFFSFTKKFKAFWGTKNEQSNGGEIHYMEKTPFLDEMFLIVVFCHALV